MDKIYKDVYDNVKKARATIKGYMNKVDKKMSAVCNILPSNSLKASNKTRKIIICSKINKELKTLKNSIIEASIESSKNQKLGKDLLELACNKFSLEFEQNVKSIMLAKLDNKSLSGDFDELLRTFDLVAYQLTDEYDFFAILGRLKDKKKNNAMNYEQLNGQNGIAVENDVEDVPCNPFEELQK